jgi:hypothetical protein
MDVLYALVVGSLMSTKIRPYPDTVHVSGMVKELVPGIDNGCQQ